MLNRRGNLGLGLTLLTATLVFSGAAMAGEHGGALEARRHGYEHGYRDGYHHGREDRARRASRDYRSEDYKHGERGYESYMGKKGDFKKGYREGYAVGYNDGFDGRPGRFAEIYGVVTRSDPDAPYENDRDDDIYVRRGYGVSDVAFDIGYRDGLEAGRHDREANQSFNVEAHGRYREALHGYNPRYGDQESYRSLYRRGYTEGYRDGYGGR